MKKINKKGIELSLQTVVIFIIALIVLFVMFNMFSEGFTSGVNQSIEIGQGAINEQKNKLIN